VGVAVEAENPDVTHGIIKQAGTEGKLGETGRGAYGTYAGDLCSCRAGTEPADESRLPEAQSLLGICINLVVYTTIQVRAIARLYRKHGPRPDALAGDQG
jgi:hypothetical protein